MESGLSFTDKGGKRNHGKRDSTAVRELDVHYLEMESTRGGVNSYQRARKRGLEDRQVPGGRTHRYRSRIRICRTGRSGGRS